jgi:hypothetical protein
VALILFLALSATSLGHAVAALLVLSAIELPTTLELVIQMC